MAAAARRHVVIGDTEGELWLCDTARPRAFHLAEGVERAFSAIMAVDPKQSGAVVAAHNFMCRPKACRSGSGARSSSDRACFSGCELVGRSAIYASKFEGLESNGAGFGTATRDQEGRHHAEPEVCHSAAVGSSPRRPPRASRLPSAASRLPCCARRDARETRACCIRSPVRLSYSGQQGRLGATFAIEEINAAGGIKALAAPRSSQCSATRSRRRTAAPPRSRR